MPMPGFSAIVHSKAAGLDAELRCLEISEIVASASEAELPDLAGAARDVLRALPKAGVSPLEASALISAFNASLLKRSAELLADEFALGDRWCLLSFGSWARMEQTLSTDQDHGLAYELPEGADPEAERSKMLAFGEALSGRLETLGFERCPGGVMSSNPDFCMDSAAWRSKFSAIFACPTPDALLSAGICFDMKGGAGKTSIADELHSWVLERAPHAPLFLRLLCEDSLRWTPALGMFWGFRADKDGSVDLKARGAKPLVDAARLLALASGAPGVGTVERLRSLADAGKLSPSLASGLESAFSHIQGLRLSDGAASNRIVPKALPPEGRAELLSAMKVARSVQQKTRLDFGLAC